MNYSSNLSIIVLICGMKLLSAAIWSIVLFVGMQQEYFIDYFNWIETVEQVKLPSESFELNLFYCSLTSKSSLGGLSLPVHQVISVWNQQ